MMVAVFVSFIATTLLTIVSSFRYILCKSSSPGRTPPGGTSGRSGRGRCPRAEFAAPLPGGPGIMPAGTTTGVRGASLEVGVEPAVISAALAKPPRSLARIAPRDHTPLGKSRGGTPAGERARERKGGASRLLRGASRTPYLRAGLTTVRLPAFRFLLFAGSELRRVGRAKRNPPWREERWWVSLRSTHPTDRTRISFRYIRATGYGPFRHRCLTSLARRSRCETGIVLLSLLPARGEKSRSEATRMRGPLRNSERCG